MPTRRPADLETLLAEVPELRLLIMDRVKRPIRWPEDKDDWQQNYSGKKKAHRKNNLLVSGHQRQIVYLGPAAVGKVHDKSWLTRVV